MITIFIILGFRSRIEIVWLMENTPSLPTEMV